MKPYFYTFLLLLLSTISIYAQNSFLNNPILYNPAIAGHNNLLDVTFTGYLLSRNSIVSNGNGQSLNISAPLRMGQFGVGGHLVRDEFSVYDITEVNFFGGYHKNIGSGKMSLGASLGITRDAVDHSRVIPNGYEDVDYLPNVGFGAIWNNRLGYIAVSCPNIYEALRISYADSLGYVENSGLENRKFNIVAGLRLANRSGTFMIQPSILISKPLDDRTFEEFFKFSCSLQIHEVFWLNASYVMNNNVFFGSDYIKFEAGYAFKNGYRMKLSYMASYIWQNIDHFGLELLLGYRMARTEGRNDPRILLFF